jgi:acetyl esterase/lipase
MDRSRFGGRHPLRWAVSIDMMRWHGCHRAGRSKHREEVIMHRLSVFLATVVILLLAPLVALPRPFVLAQEATPVVEWERSVTFGEANGRPLQLDVYRPPTRDEPRPAVVVLPGWGMTRLGIGSQARELAEAGYVAVAADYTLKWPEFIDDAQLAVRWVRANAERYGIDPERICAYGWSAGGQLAAMLAVRDTRDTTDPELGEYSSRVACAVDLAGTTDATIPHPDPSENRVRAEELGGTLEEAPEAYQDVSPVAFVDEQSAPMLIMQGTVDTTNPVEQSRLLATALQEAGVEVIYAELAGVGHGIDSWYVNGPFALAFLDRHLHPER